MSVVEGYFRYARYHPCFVSNSIHLLVKDAEPQASMAVSQLIENNELDTKEVWSLRALIKAWAIASRIICTYAWEPKVKLDFQKHADFFKPVKALLLKSLFRASTLLSRSRALIRQHLNSRKDRERIQSNRVGADQYLSFKLMGEKLETQNNTRVPGSFTRVRYKFHHQSKSSEEDFNKKRKVLSRLRKIPTAFTTIIKLFLSN